MAGSKQRGLDELAASQLVSKIDTTMGPDEAKRYATKYGTRGALPRNLPRDERMRAYEGRYVAAGGPKGERWHRTERRSEQLTTASIVGAGSAASVDLAARGRRAGRVLRRAKIDPVKLSGRAGNIGLGTAVLGAGAEVLRRHADKKRRSYSSSPAGVAASALRRMRGYSPEG